MPAAQSSHPRVRLSISTHPTLSHDIAAAFKASQPISIRTIGVSVAETPAPPPSPVDFGFTDTNKSRNS
ncbi:hypothetical protein P152DRAFT_403512 [Eremomyces bilateralis CBS 781.70]|uniref:Uncharacterized protein n=1 Tax=Eremomyces bilateralis CBS 781.70 TaxID=1392243 RepID=A0A6G1FUJ5_9PEZI|nr:uncharacterized protein P152DRAFT_403512 [Eremomyces bilateralis CBS 781.70]KAF1809362.1 hypothetical protein P152DRAFT_403512 [Eremomyces bilateralis CBS 781.70]